MATKTSSDRDDLWPHQLDAVNACLKTLSRHDRAQIHMACGSGKTRVASALMSSLQGDIVVWLCPTIELMLQTLHGTEGSLPSHKRLLVAFFNKSTFFEKTDFAHTVEGVKEGLSRKTLVFCTYASFPVLDEALSQEARKITLLIADEAHKTASHSKALYARWLNPLANVEKRLAMTATPRATSTAEDHIEVMSMADETVFGPVAFSYSFEQAVTDGIVCGVQALIPIVIGRPDSFEARLSAIRQARESFGLKRILTFHNTVRDARDFAAFLNDRDIEALHVNGRMPRYNITKARARLEADTPIVLTNARLFGEGIDVPALDAVFFCTFKSSRVDITQQIGRVVRIQPGKSLGYVILPASERHDLGDIFVRGRFSQLWRVLTDVLDAVGPDERVVHSAGMHRPLLLGSSRADEEEFNGKFERLLALRSVELGRQSWISRALDVIAWLEAGNLPYQNGSPHALWISDNSRAFARGELSEEKAALMSRILDIVEERKEERLKRAKRYVSALERGGEPDNRLTVLIRDNRRSPDFKPLYQRMMAVRRERTDERRQRRLDFLQAYEERGEVVDRSMYAQFVAGIRDTELAERFKRVHTERLKRKAEELKLRQSEAVRRFRNGEAAQKLAAEFGVTVSTIWYWNRTITVDD
jgi:superfamily II DNA or RNA helicase